MVWDIFYLIYSKGVITKGIDTVKIKTGILLEEAKCKMMVRR
jgi:hypothetical protein